MHLSLRNGFKLRCVKEYDTQLKTEKKKIRNTCPEAWFPWVGLRPVKNSAPRKSLTMDSDLWKL